MDRKYSCDVPSIEEIVLTRRSTIGHQTEQLNEMEYVIANFVLHSNFKMDAFVKACSEHPQIKDETKLVHEIFLKPHFVQDLIKFLMAPLQMMGKFRLNVEEGRSYVKTIAEFMKQNYQFYEFYFLSLEKGALELEDWFEFLDDCQSNTFYPSLGYLVDIFMPFVKYEFSTSTRITEHFQKINHERGILLINNFSEALLGRLLHFTQHEAVFKVLFNLVLVSLQEQEWKRSLALLKGLCQSGISLGATLDSTIQNLFWMAREVGNNIDKDVHNTIFAFTDAIVQTNLVGASLSRIFSIFQNSDSFKQSGFLVFEEEAAVQYNLKLLGEVVNIYFQLRSNGIDHLAGQMVKLKHSILQVYHSFDRIVKLFRIGQSRTLNFSSGENIRSIAIYRFEFLNLLRTCLLLIKEFGDSCHQLKLNMDKSEVLQLLTRCLSENRWNSIVHCLIEKIVCLMINTEFFKTRSTGIRRFLSFLVQAFNNKKYIFLNSAKMTNQGDLHSLYFISRKITVELDRMPAIVDSTSQYDFWKNFVLNVLQKYENSCERLSSKVDFEEEMEKEKKKERDGDFRVEIDQVALIKEIVKKIEVNRKWSFKKETPTSVHRIGSASDLKKKRASQRTDRAVTPGLHSKFRNSIIHQQKIKPYPEHPDPVIRSGCIKEANSQELSSQDELQLSVSNQSSQEMKFMMQQSAHSDADQLDEEVKSDKDKMTQSGW